MKNGIDISNYQNITNWSQVKATGILYVYIKATEGVTYANPKLEVQYKGAKSVGLLVGFYHFARSNPMQAEFNHFRDTIKNYKQDLRPVLDYEIGNPDFNYIKLFMAQNSNLLFYSSHSIADITNISNKDIWIAEPNTNPSNTKGYAGIQNNFHGSLSGLQGEVDLDLFDEMILNKGITINNIVGSVNNMCIKSGEKSRRVSLLQAILNVIFTGSIKAIDGDFGSITLGVVIRYQKAMGLTADGEVGSKTITMLIADIKNNYFKL